MSACDSRLQLRRSRRLSGLPPDPTFGACTPMPPFTEKLESRLLNLPPEIRDMIWEFTVGGRTIHLTNSSGRNDIVASLCKSKQTSAQLHKTFTSDDPDAEYYGVKSSDSSKFARSTNTALQTNHSGCHKTAKFDLDLRLLRVNKQIQTEAKLIPYAANEFIFDNACAFQIFLDRRSSLQKHAIKSIGLLLECDDYVHKFSQCGMAEPHVGYWNVVLTPAKIAELSGLQNLQVHLRTFFDSPGSYELLVKMGADGAGCLFYFRLLSLKRVSTIVSDWDLHTYAAPEDEEVYPNMTLKKRQALAKQITDAVLGRIGANETKWRKFLDHFGNMSVDDFLDHHCFDEEWLG